MSQVTDMKMAINATFESILNEIQLSNLNFSIQMTPFAAYIVLKKSTIKDLNGVPATPSPPVLYLLQRSQQEHLAVQDENHKLKAALEMLKKKNDTMVCENVGLRKEIEVKNNAIEAMEANHDNLRSRLDLLEDEKTKSCATKAATELKIKEMKNKHTEEIRDLEVQVGKLSKTLKGKEKVDNDLYNARENIKTLKSEKSLLRTIKTKLEGEIRKLEKRLKIIENKKVSHAKAAASTKKNDDRAESKNVDNEANYITSLAPDQTFPTIFPSFVSHWNPHLGDTPPQSRDAFPSMISHCVVTPPEEDKLLTKEDFLKIWAEHREQVKKDWAEIFSKISFLNI